MVQCKIVPEQAQEKFRESEHRLRLAIEAGGLGFFEHHISEHRILVSSNFCRIFALPFQPSISPAEWAERVHPDDRIQVLIGVQRMINTQSVLDIEYRLLLPNKVVRWIHVMASPLVEDGKIVRSDGVVQDITQRKESELELRGLARAVGQSPVSVVITDLHGVIEYVNPKFCAVTGYSSEEVKGKNPRVLKSGEMPAETYRQLWATITAGQEWRGEFHNRTKNGDLYWEAATISAIRDDKGNITHFVAIKEDITERKRAAEILQHTEKELAESQRWQSAILDTAPDHVWIRDRGGRFLAVNHTWCDFAGVKESEMLGKTIAELPKIYPADLVKRLLAEDEAVMSSGQISQRELQLTSPTLGTVCLESSKAPLLDAEGVPCGVVGIGRDITKRKQAEKELLEAKLFLHSTLDALSAHIAILDEQGMVVAVNAAWSQFARQNAFLGSNYGIGANYLALCETAVGECAAEAPAVAKGIRAVMAGQCGEFVLEYPCHGPQEQRWFVVRVTRFAGEAPVKVVVAHENITARKLAEEELQWKTAFLEAQVRSSIDGILAVDEAGRKIMQNERMADLLKIPKHIAEGKYDETQLKWVTQATKNPEQFLEKVNSLNSHQKEISRDEMEMKDGTILDRYTSPMIGEDGKYYGRMWTFRDITKRKQAEAALKEQLALRERLAKIAANVPGIIYSFRLRPDGSTCIPYASPTIEEFYGARAEDLVDDASQAFDLIHPDDRARTQESIAESSRTMLPWRVEFRVRHPKKGLFWVEGQSSPERETDGSILWHGFMSDITERRRLETQMEQLRSEHEIILTTIGEGLQWIDVDGRIKYENPAAARMLGYEVCELIGKPAHSAIHYARADGSAYPRCECPIHATLRDNVIRRVTDEVFWRKDGTSFDVEYTCRPVYEKEGRSGGTMILFTDVTERKRAQAELEKLEREATEHKLAEEHSHRELKHERELNQIKSQFVSMVSHEFRTPLCVINTAASLLEDYSTRMTGEERTEHTQQIEHAVDRMAQMMEDLLVHEKLQTGKMECTPSLMDMEAFCRELISEITKQVGPACMIECAIDSAAREAFLDKRILRHILCNLLSNAVKYSKDRQPVTLEVKRVAAQAQTGRDMETVPGDRIQLVIRDLGIGIPEADVAKLFQTFHRAGNVGNRPGTGMGLAIVKKFVDLHRGTIHIESKEGEGTTVRVWLPIASSDVAKHEN